jgi:predicted choloylglycine hydrolase
VYPKQFLSIVFLIFFSLFTSTCIEDENPITSANQTYETSYGTVTKVDDYPLFTLNYTTDYKFDEYLQTGIFPFLASQEININDFSCTCFSAFGNNNGLLGRNYDWQESSTYYILYTNPPNGYSSISTVDLSFFEYNHDKPPDFSGNQNTLRILPYHPFDGINEKGVAVGMNAVPYANSPYDGSKVTIGELQLIRLVLDYAGSTEEAINLIQQYNIRMEEPPVHYLIADSSGHSAIAEFVNGNMEIMENSVPFQVTTNFVITGLNDPQNAPCWRYRNAYETLNTRNGKLSENEAIMLLQDVSVTYTRWSTVFNLKEIKLQTAMGRDYGNVHQFGIP